MIAPQRKYFVRHESFLLLALCLWLGTAAGVFSQSKPVVPPDTERVKAARAFLDVFGYNATFLESQLRETIKREDYLPRFADRLPDETARKAFETAFEEVKAEAIQFAKTTFEPVLDQLALAYAEHLSVEDLNAVAELFRGPLKSKGTNFELFAPVVGEEGSGNISPEHMKAAQDLLDTLIGGIPHPKGTQETVVVPEVAIPNSDAQDTSTIARTFTFDEINALLAFYRTPSGKRYLAAFPDLMAAQMTLGLKWVQPVQQLLEARLSERFPER